MRPIRAATPDVPDTRDRADHWTTRANCTTPKGIQAHEDAITFEGKLACVEYAKLFCEECPVKIQCMTEYGDLEHGVIAGTTPQERKELRRGAA